MDDCVELAREFGARIAGRHGIPVYLYAQAATRADRVKLADVRRGQYEGLKVEIGTNGRQPDFGPTRMHPRFGAVAVGARAFLVAWNINLDTDDVDLAKRIARRVRESGGGLPRLQANGFRVEEPERGAPVRAQVSMNLLDTTVTPIWQAWEAVRELAGEDGIRVAESELIGLAPLAALLDVADHAKVPGDAVGRGSPGGRRGRDQAARLHAAHGPGAPPGGVRSGGAEGRGRPRGRPGPRMSLRLIEGGRGSTDAPGLLVHGAAQVATLAGGLRRGPDQGDAAVLDAAAAGGLGSPRAPVVACWEGRIVAVGPRDEVEASLERQGYSLARFVRLDADGGIVTPGLVDPHTHLLFGGTREGELALRQRGAGYLEILAAGGGILSTVAATRAATDEQLAAHGRRWLDEMCAHGVTTVEAKSGYGLDLATELRLLAVAHELGREGPVDVVPTWLGAHAVPPEFRARPDAAEAYVRHLLDVQLPGVAAQGRARSCDAFCEQGVFTADQCRRVLSAAAGFGMTVRVHADQLGGSGGAELAVELGALSADHLHSPSDAGVAAMAAAAVSGSPVVATLLPATSWFLMEAEPAPGRRFIDAGVPVALGTDFNPGTSPVSNLALVMSFACLGMRLTPAEALAGVTINAAHAVGVADEVGSLEPGKAADLVVWRAASVEQLPYWAGANLAEVVIKRGRIVHRRAG